jgi:hypothetical protein
MTTARLEQQIVDIVHSWSAVNPVIRPTTTPAEIVPLRTTLTPEQAKKMYDDSRIAVNSGTATDWQRHVVTKTDTWFIDSKTGRIDNWYGVGIALGKDIDAANRAALGAEQYKQYKATGVAQPYVPVPVDTTARMQAYKDVMQPWIETRQAGMRNTDWDKKFDEFVATYTDKTTGIPNYYSIYNALKELYKDFKGEGAPEKFPEVILPVIDYKQAIEKQFGIMPQAVPVVAPTVPTPENIGFVPTGEWEGGRFTPTAVAPRVPSAPKIGEWFVYKASDEARLVFEKAKFEVDKLISRGKLISGGVFVGMDENNKPKFFTQQELDKLPAADREILTTEGYGSYLRKQGIDIYNKYTAENKLSEYIIGTSTDENGITSNNYDVARIIADLNNRIGNYNDKMLLIKGMGFQNENELLQLIRPDDVVPIQNIFSMTEADWAKYGVRDAGEYFYLHSGIPGFYENLIKLNDEYNLKSDPDYKVHDLKRFGSGQSWIDPQIDKWFIFDYDIGKQLNTAWGKGVGEYNTALFPAVSEQLQRQIGKIDFDTSLPVMVDGNGDAITLGEMLLGATIIQNTPAEWVIRAFTTDKENYDKIKGITKSYDTWWTDNVVAMRLREGQESTGQKITSVSTDEKACTDRLTQCGVPQAKAAAMGKQFTLSDQLNYHAIDAALGFGGMVYGLYAFIFGTIPSTTAKTTVSLVSGKPSEAVREVLTLAKDLFLFPLSVLSTAAGDVTTGRYGKLFGEAVGLAGMRVYSPENIPRLAKAGVSIALPHVSDKGLVYSPKLSLSSADPSKMAPNLKFALWNDIQNRGAMEDAQDLGFSTKTTYDSYGGVRYEYGDRITPPAKNIAEAFKNAVASIANPATNRTVLDNYGRPIQIGKRGDIVRVTPLGTFEYRKAPEFRLSGVTPAINHLTRAKAAMLEELSKNTATIAGKTVGYIVIKAEGEAGGGIFGSPNARDVGFTKRGPEAPWPQDAVNFRIMYSPRDRMMVPEEIYKEIWKGNYDRASEILVELNRTGKIKPGVYNTFKMWLDNVEDELWLPAGMKLYAVPKEWIPIYARVRGEPTAKTLMESPYTVGRGKESIKEGDWLPEYWLMTEKAIEDRLMMPSLVERYMQKRLGLLTTMRKFLNMQLFSKIEWDPEFRSQSWQTRLPTIKGRAQESSPVYDDIEITMPDGTQRLAVRYAQVIPKAWVNKIIKGMKLSKTMWFGEERLNLQKPWISVFLVDRANGKIYFTQRKSGPFESGTYTNFADEIRQFPPEELLSKGDTFENQAVQIAKDLANVEAKSVTRLGPYEGRTDINALQGSRVFVVELEAGVVPKLRPNINTDLLDVKEWNARDVNDKIVVTPPIYDQLRGVAAAMPDLGIDMSRVKETESGRKFNIGPLFETVDRGFANRVKSGTQESEAAITRRGLHREEARSQLEQTYAPVQITTLSMPHIEPINERLGVLKVNPANFLNSVRLDEMQRGKDQAFVGRAMSGKGAIVSFIGDLHGTYINLFRDINEKGKIVEGDPNDINTWHWIGGDRILTQLGDIRDRGPNARAIELAFNRLRDEAQLQGGDVVRVLGNHDLAYLRGEEIPGIKYTKAGIAQARQEILDDINNGYVVPAAAVHDMLLTHAGVSLSKFPEWIGLSADEIVADINNRFYTALNSANPEKTLWEDPIFHLGSGETGKSGAHPTYDEGGIFWFRPFETKSDANMWLDSKGESYPQIMGHTPDKFGRIQHLYTDATGMAKVIMVDVGRDFWTREEIAAGRIGDPKAGRVLHMEITTAVPPATIAMGGAPTATVVPPTLPGAPIAPRVAPTMSVKTAIINDVQSTKGYLRDTGEYPISLWDVLNTNRLLPDAQQSAALAKYNLPQLIDPALRNAVIALAENGLNPAGSCQGHLAKNNAFISISIKSGDNPVDVRAKAIDIIQKSGLEPTDYELFLLPDGFVGANNAIGTLFINMKPIITDFVGEFSSFREYYNGIYGKYPDMAKFMTKDNAKISSAIAKYLQEQYDLSPTEINRYLKEAMDKRDADAALGKKMEEEWYQKNPDTLPKTEKGKIEKTPEQIFEETYGRYRGKELPISGREELTRMRVTAREKADMEAIARAERDRLAREEATRARPAPEEERRPLTEEERPRVTERERPRIAEVPREAVRFTEERRPAEETRREMPRAERRETREQREQREQRKIREQREARPELPQRGGPPRIPIVPRVPVRPTLPPPRQRVEDILKKGGEGLIAWKQGFIYKVIYPNYTQTDILNTRRPVEGVEYHRGPRAAYDSVVRRGGYIPPIIRRKMGIYNLEFRSDQDRRRPEIKFTRNPERVYRGKKRIKAIARMPKTRISRF